MAAKLGVHNLNTRRRKNGDLSFLFNKNKEIFYLWGFIMADGNFSKKGDLFIGLNKKDLKFLETLILLIDGDKTKIKIRKFKNNYTGQNSEMCVFRVGHINMVRKINKLIGFNGPKTYIPPTNIKYFFIPELFIYFLIGLIDGDGSIWISKNWPNIRIEVHYNWLKTFKKISKVLFKFYGINAKVKISKRGFVQLYINDKKSIHILLKASEEVPRLDRKWIKLYTTPTLF
jgi:hypothetical protein